MEIDEFLKMVSEVERVLNKYGYSIAYAGPSTHGDKEFTLELLLKDEE